MAFDAVGNVEYVTDPADNVTGYAYDRNRRLIRQTDPLGRKRVRTIFRQDRQGKIVLTRLFARLFALSQYNSAGLAYRTIDNLGRINETQFDDAGRTVRTIQSYANGTVEETDTDQDATVAYEYGSGARLVTMTAYNAKGPGNGVQSQATKYLYTSALNASWPSATVYPDSIDVLSQNSTTKVWTITTDNGDHISTAYDRLGRSTSMTDQRGVVHAYTFDSAGRLAADTATDLGSTGIVDGSIRRIGAAYDDIGRVQRVTSYSDTAGTTAVNQVKSDYNGWGYVAYEYQEHNGTVDGSTPRVEYDFDDGASGGVARYVRQFATVYPNGRTVQYGYGQTQAIDDVLSRLATIGDGTNTFASYKYLGAGKIVTEDYEDIDVKLDYSANNLAALDRFGRVVDQVWADYGSTPETFDEFTYAYNRAGNRTARTNALHTAFNESYGYNDLDELTSSSRTDGYDQSWTLDGLGNWSGYNDDGTSQTRTTNTANEITATSGIGTPTYDRAGNMTVIPSPVDGNPTRTLGGKYDAWDRLVEVTDGGSSLAKFIYDGNGRRIEQLTNFVDGVPQNATHYYLSGAQVLETREGSPTAAPESLSPKYQNVWSARYIDALVLRDTYSSGVLQPDSRLYYLSDANANVTAVVGKVSNVWQVVERYVYSPYGEATIYTPDWSTTRATSLYNNTTLFAGRELDTSTGLYYNRARYYSASLGTFVGRDPIGYGGGSNLYEYVGDSPTNATDPFGLQSPESLRSRAFTSIDRWSVNTGWRAVDFTGTLVTSLVGNAIAKPAVWLGTHWREDTAADRINAITARQEAINQSKPMGTGRALVNLYAGATTDQIAFGAVGYDPVQRRSVEGAERWQRIGGGAAGYATTWIPFAAGARAIPAGRFNPTLCPPRKVPQVAPAPVEEPIVFKEVPNPAPHGKPSMLRPGPYARESVPIKGVGRRPTAAQQQAINELGRKHGCHTCGTKKPGTASGNFVGDHQPPTEMTLPGQSQRLYPQCWKCSQQQGGHVRKWGG